MTTPLERLLAEELPTGTFGGPRPPSETQQLPHWARPPVSELEAARHRAVLLAELDAYEADRRKPARHLHPVPTDTPARRTA